MRPEVVPGFGMARPKRDRRTQRRQRALQIFRPPAGRTEVILRIEERGRELHRTGELGERAWRVTQLPEHEATAIVRFRHCGCVADRVRKHAPPHRKILATLGDEPEQVVRLGRCGILLERGV